MRPRSGYLAAAAVAAVFSAGTAGAQDDGRKTHVSLAPVVAAHFNGPQASPFSPSSDGTVSTGFGLDLVLARAAERLPMELRVGWTMHDLENTASGPRLTGDSHLIRAMLSTYRLYGATQRLKLELGAGVLHSRSNTTVQNVGGTIGLPAVNNTVEVIETSPMVGTAATIRLWQGAALSTALRVGLDFAFSDGATTMLMPIGLQFTR